MIGLFAQAAGATAPQPVVSDEVGMGMVLVNAFGFLTMLVQQVIGYLKSRDEKSTEVALLKREHETCKEKTAVLETTVARQADELANHKKLLEDLRVEIGTLRAELQMRNPVQSKK
jgi:hypothetical protein